MPRPIEALIHTDALAHNLTRARVRAPDARLWAVVKANAYGHGIERAFEGLRSADGFALLDLAEAERIRACGWRGPVLLLEGAFEARDLELSWFAPASVARGPLQRTGRLAGRAQDAPATSRVPEDEQRHEPARLRCRAIGLCRLYSGALRLSAGSRDASASAIYARQRMEEALLVPNPAEGVEQGRFGERYRWQVETSFVPRWGKRRTTRSACASR